MDNEEIAVAINILQTKMETMSTNVEQAVSRIEKCITEMKDSYKDMFRDINCRIDDRIKSSDENQKRLEARISSLEKNYAIIAFIGAVLGTLALKAVDYLF